MPDFPTTIDAIDPAFLSSVLGQEVTAVSAESDGLQGTLSSSTRLRLTLAERRADGDTEADVPRTLLAKTAHAADEIQAIGKQTGMYVKEVRFYETLGRATGLPIPDCHFAAYDEASGAFLLLLEDMSDSRGGQLFASDLADVTRVIDELPAFHAAWWNHSGGAAEPWLWRVDQPPVVEGFLGGLQHTAPTTIANFRLEGAFRATAERLAEEYPRFAALWNERPVTVAHGDLHLQQVFFPRGERGDESGRFALFDWQTVMVANPGVDIARLLATNLSVELRRTHERALVTRYHAGLLAAGITDYSPEECWQDYRLGQVWNLVVVLNGGSVADPEEADRAARAHGSSAAEFLGRAAAAAADLEVNALLG